MTDMRKSKAKPAPVVYCWSDAMQLQNAHKTLTPKNHIQQTDELHQVSEQKGPSSL